MNYIVDAVVDVVAGVVSDYFEMARFGKRRFWYIFGVFFAVPGFAGFFQLNLFG